MSLLNRKYLIRVFTGLFLILFDILFVCIKYFDIIPEQHFVSSVIRSANPILFVFILILALYLILHRPREVKNGDKVDVSRRRFLTFSATLAHDESFQAINGKLGKGVASFTGRRNPKSKHPLFPAGGKNYEDFRTKCNSCMACIESCPSHILEPGIKLGQGVIPRITFNHGWCPPDCTVCNDVCPTGALSHITVEEKSNIQIGHALWIRENCLTVESKECRACEEACKNGCIEMVRNGRKLYPIINTVSCTGCGACENVCPATPLKGIYVESFQEHRLID